MNSIFTVALLSLVLAGCAHPINITPDSKAYEQNLEPSKIPVGYFISESDREMQVKQSGGGGDKVTYYPYRELEPALQKVLFQAFIDTKKLSGPPTAQNMTASKIQYAFIPEFTTEAYSSGILTWPPTKFIVKCSIRALDTDGTTVWTGKYEGVGEATNSEWNGDFGLAGKRAAANVFKKMAEDIRNFPKFKIPKTVKSKTT